MSRAVAAHSSPGRGDARHAAARALLVHPEFYRVGVTAELTLLDHMGGPMGFVYSTIPVVVFVAANAFLSLPWTIGLSIGVALALTGMVWNLLHGGTHDWRADRSVLRAHDVATLAMAAVCGARFGVEQWLYDIDATGWLGVAKIAMCTPLTVVAALVVVWAFRRNTRQLVSEGSTA